MAENPVDNDSAESGLGINLAVTLIPTLDPNKVKGEVAATVGDQLVNYVNSVQAQAKEIGRIFDKIAAVGNIKENRTPERVSSYKAFSDQLDVFSKVVTSGFSDIAKPSEAVAVTGLTGVLANNLTQLTKSLPGLKQPVTTSNKAEIKAVNALGQELNTAIANYNRAVKLVAKATRAKTEPAPAVDLLSSLQPVSSKELTQLELQDAEARRQAAHRQKMLQKEAIRTQRAAAYKPAVGMAFDLETAYRQEGPIGEERRAKGLPLDNLWSIGTKRLDDSPVVTFTRNLEKDQIPLEEFNRQFVKDAPTTNLKSSRGLIASFLTEYAKAGGSMGLNGPNLPLLVGQNVANDLQILEEAAKNLPNLPGAKPSDTRLSQRLLSITDRLLRGDQQHMLRELMVDFEGFITGKDARGGLGYTGYNIRSHGGAKLENQAAALQKTYLAHDVGSDAAMAAEIFQTLNEPDSRQRLLSKTPGISSFSFNKWRKSFEDTKTAELLRKTVGPDNEAVVQEYLAKGTVPTRYIGDLNTARQEAIYKTDQIFRPEILGNPAMFSMAEVRKTADPSDIVKAHKVASDAIKQAFVSQLFSEKDELTGQNFNSRVDALLQSSLVQDNIRKVIDSYGITGEVRKAAHAGLEMQLRSVADLTRGAGFEKARTFSTAESELAEQLIESKYGKGTGLTDLDNLTETRIKFDKSAKGIFESLLNPALENNAKEFADLTTLNAKAKFWKPEEFRTSFVAAHFKDKGNIDLETLRSLASTGAWLPDTISQSAASRGNTFEEKVFTDVKKNFADKYKLVSTTVDKEGQAELSYKIPGTGKGIVGHPDGFGVDLETRQPFIAEAKYAGSEKLAKLIKTGQPLREWEAQTNLYAMMAGLPVGTPVKYFVGNLDRATPELAAIDDQLKNTKDLSAKGKLKLEETKEKLLAELQTRPLSEYNLGDVAVIETKTSAAVQKQLRTLLTNIFDTPMSALEKSNLPKYVEDFFVKELKLDPAKNITAQIKDILTKTTGDANVSRLRSAIGVEQKVAEGEVSISEGGKKPPRPPKSGGGEPPDDDDDDDDKASKTRAQKRGEDYFDPDDTRLETYKRDLNQQLAVTDKAYASAESKYLLAESKRTGLIKLAKAYEGPEGLYKMPASVETEYEAQRAQVESQLIRSYNEMRALGLARDTLRTRISKAEEPELFDPEVIQASAASQNILELQARQQAAKQAAFKAAVDIEAKGLSTATLLPATKAAKELQALGLEGSAGYTGQALLQRASKEKVAFSDLQLPAVTTKLDQRSSIQVLKGEQSSIKSVTELTKDANDAVGKLFEQLYTVGGKTFISPAVKEFETLIKKSQEAITKADHFKQKAAIAGEQVSFLTSQDDTTGVKKARQIQLTSEEAYARNLEKAKQYAREADKYAKELPSSGVVKTYSSPEEKQALEVEARNTELAKLESLYRKKAELEVQSTLPSFAPTGKHYQAVADLDREIKNITKGYEAEKFDITLTTKIATVDAQANLDEFILNASKQAVHLKAKIDTEGLTSESLRATLANNMALASKGVTTPGYSTPEVLSKAIDSGVEIVPSLQPNLEVYSSMAGTKFNQKSTFDDLLRDNKLVDSTIRELYSALAADLPTDGFLTDSTKEFKRLQIEATQAVDKVKQLTAAAKIAREESTKTTDSAEKENLEKAAAKFEKDALTAAATAKAQVVNLEAKASTTKHNIYSPEATSKLENDLKEELALEKELLQIEQQRLSTLLKMGLGTATTKPVPGAITAENAKKLIDVNTRLGALGVESKPDVLTNKQVFTVASKGGITEEQITGKQGRNVDFLGSTVDLIEWQMQWLSGVAVLGTVSAAFRNTFLFAVQFEAVLKNIQLITQANNSEMTSLYGSLEELTRKFQFSVSELGEGLIILGQAGFTATESLAVLPNITALATATMSNLKVAADVTTTALEAFQLPVEKSESLVNALAAMTIESKLDIEKLGTTFNYVASSAASAGLSIEETGTALGLMSNAGVRASTGGTTLRSVLGVLEQPTAKFRAALSKVGLTIDDVNPSTNRLSDIFLKLKDSGFDVESAFAGLDKRIAGGVITLIHSADQWEDFQGKITNTNRAFDMAEGQMDTLQAQTKRLANTFQLFGKSWFGGNLDELKEATKLITSVVTVASKGAAALPDEVKSSINAILGTTTALSVLTTSYNSWRKEKDAVSNLRKLNVERGLPPDTNISTRSRKIQSTMEFIFNPKMIGWAAAITAAIAGTSTAISILSGEAAKLEAVGIAEEFEAQTKVLTETIKLYNEATLGTKEFVKAQEMLLKLGIKDFSKDNLEYLQSISRINTAAAQERAAKASGTEYSSTTTELLRYIKPKEDEAAFDTAAANDFEAAVRRQGLFYSGTQSDIIDYAVKTNFMRPTDTLPPKAVQTVLDLSSQAKASDDYQANLAGEVRARFSALAANYRTYDKAENITETLLKEVTKFETNTFDIYDIKNKDYASTWQDLVGRVQKEFPTYDLSKGKNQLNIGNLLRDRLAKIQSDKAALQDDSELNLLYEELILGNDSEVAYSGSQRQAEEKFNKAIKELNDALANQGNIFKMPEGRTRTNLLYTASKRVEAAKKRALQSNKRLGLLTGLEGETPATIKLIDQYLDLITIKTEDGSRTLDKQGIEQFKKIPAIITTKLGDELEKLATDQQDEFNQLPKELQTNEEIKLAIRLKYDLKRDEVLQSAIDEVFKPIVNLIEKREAIDSILRNIQQEKEVLSGDILIDAIQGEGTTLETKRSFIPGLYDGLLKDVAGSQVNDITTKGYLNLTADKYWSTGTTGLRPRQEFSDIRPEPYYVPAYTQDTAARDKIGTARKVLEQKELNEQRQLELKKEALAAEHAARMQKLGDTGLQPNIDQRNQAIAEFYSKLTQLELEYKKTQLSTIKEVEALRSQQLERLTTAEQAKFDSTNSLRKLVQQGYEATDSPYAESNQSTDELINRSKKEFVKAREAVKTGEFGTAKAAQSEAERLLSLIISSDRDIEDKEKATKEASDQISKFDFTYETQVSAYKTALEETNLLLGQMRDNLAKYTKEDGTATITKEDGTIVKSGGAGRASYTNDKGELVTYDYDKETGWKGQKKTADGKVLAADEIPFKPEDQGQFTDLKTLAESVDLTRQDLEGRITELYKLTTDLSEVAPAMVTVIDEKLGSIVTALSENLNSIVESLNQSKENTKADSEAKEADSEEKAMKIQTSLTIDISPTELFTSTIVNSQQMTTKMKNVIIEDLNNIPA